MYFNKKFITSKPTKKLANTPIINGTLNTKSLNFSTVAAKTIGVDNKNEYFVAASLVTPMALAVVIVTPERDTPGIKASACDNPIKNVCFNVISSYYTLFLEFLSTKYNTTPITINAIAIIIGLFNMS